MLERADVYRERTPAAITAFRRLAEQRSAEGSGRVRVLGEADFGRTERDWLEWQRYEAGINDALADWPLWELCLFDARRLPGQVLDSALRTHPNLVTPEGRGPTRSSATPMRYVRSLRIPPEPLVPTPPLLAAPDVADFIGLRHAVAARLAGVDAPREVLEDSLLAMDDMTSDAARHGQPPVDLRLWISSDRLVCTIRPRSRLG